MLYLSIYNERNKIIIKKKKLFEFGSRIRCIERVKKKFLSTLPTRRVICISHLYFLLCPFPSVSVTRICFLLVSFTALRLLGTSATGRGIGRERGRERERERGRARLLKKTPTPATEGNTQIIFDLFLCVFSCFQPQTDSTRWLYVF